MSNKKEAVSKPKEKQKDFTKKDFMNLLDVMVNPKQPVKK
jgi:hypothetical protein